MNNSDEKSPILLDKKPVLGISACCMGCPVRYNGKGFDLLKNLGREKGDFTYCPVCPETLAGLGVMRDPIHLTGENGAAVLHGEGKVVSRGGRDVTDLVLQGAQAAMQTLERAGARAFIYMDGSPTCGVYRTTLKSQKRGKPPGIFGAMLDEAGFFLIPALDLQSPLRWWDWRRRLLAFQYLTDVPLKTRGDLYAVWHRLKFLTQELDEPFARALGHELAGIAKYPGDDYLAQFRREVGDRLRKPSNSARMTQSLWKNYVYYRRQSGKTVPEVQSPEVARNITTIAKELVRMERAAAESGILFGTAPVIYSGGRKKRQADEPSGLPMDILEVRESDFPLNDPADETTKLL